MKKVLKNIFASALPQIMNIITNLILPSMIILRFGSEINGLISSIKVIISYVSIVGTCCKKADKCSKGNVKCL